MENEDPLPIIDDLPSVEDLLDPEQDPTIDKLIPGGQALTTLASGKKAMLWNALPGEQVEFEVTKEKSSYLEGTVTRILPCYIDSKQSIQSSPSPHRVIPRDECYLATSPWQIMDYPYELEQKSALITEIFDQQDIALTVGKVITDKRDYEYRNKMEYSLYWDHADQQIYLAFHQRGTHRKVPIAQSSIERPEIFAEAERIVAELNASGASARDYQSLVVRCNQSGEVSSALFENHKPHPQMKNLTDAILGHEYTYSPNGFFQINLPVYEKALLEIAKHISTDKVLDLYSGVGTIGLSVARDRQLTSVETNRSAYDELVNNAKDTDTKCVLANSEDSLDFVTSDTTVIVDPPRAGCDDKLIDHLATVKPPVIIYLSCNPVTQARDIKPLLEHYNIKTAKAYNFFPRTPHIENLVVLKLKKS
jgi:23S rRNA (uracil1939-C5)-methyltransferase